MLQCQRQCSLHMGLAEKKQFGLGLQSVPFNPTQYGEFKMTKSTHICCQHFHYEVAKLLTYYFHLNDQ